MSWGVSIQGPSPAEIRLRSAIRALQMPIFQSGPESPWRFWRTPRRLPGGSGVNLRGARHHNLWRGSGVIPCRTPDQTFIAAGPSRTTGTPIRRSIYRDKRRDPRESPDTPMLRQTGVYTPAAPEHTRPETRARRRPNLGATPEEDRRLKRRPTAPAQASTAQART